MDASIKLKATKTELVRAATVLADLNDTEEAIPIESILLLVQTHIDSHSHGSSSHLELVNLSLESLMLSCICALIVAHIKHMPVLLVIASLELPGEQDMSGLASVPQRVQSWQQLPIHTQVHSKEGHVFVKGSAVDSRSACEHLHTARANRRSKGLHLSGNVRILPDSRLTVRTEEEQSTILIKVIGIVELFGSHLGGDGVSHGHWLECLRLAGHTCTNCLTVACIPGECVIKASSEASRCLGLEASIVRSPLHSSILLVRHELSLSLAKVLSKLYQLKLLHLVSPVLVAMGKLLYKSLGHGGIGALSLILDCNVLNKLDDFTLGQFLSPAWVSTQDHLESLLVDVHLLLWLVLIVGSLW